MQEEPHILISGGGTGGHIFPAIAIANEIKRRRPHAQILFVGANDKMEMEKVPKAGYPIKGLWISGIKRSLSWSNLLFPFKLCSSYIRSGHIVRKFRPQIAIGTGGFASGPALHAAIRHKVPALIQEQNSFPGITNRILARKADRICVAYTGMEKYFPASKIRVTGNPVRHSIVQSNINPEKAKEEFGFFGEKKLLLVVGGSLGSRTLNNCMKNNLALFRDANIQIIWQTGAEMYAGCKSAVRDFPDVRVFDFIYNMDHAYASADVIVSRAGAIAISELCFAGRAVILVPFPYAAEDHQTKNALALVEAGAAIHVRDRDAAQQLAPEILNLFHNAQKRSELAENIVKLAKPEATEHIVDEVFRLMEEKNNGIEK